MNREEKIKILCEVASKFLTTCQINHIELIPDSEINHAIDKAAIVFKCAENKVNPENTPEAKSYGTKEG